MSAPQPTTVDRFARLEHRIALAVRAGDYETAADALDRLFALRERQPFAHAEYITQLTNRVNTDDAALDQHATVLDAIDTTRTWIRLTGHDAQRWFDGGASDAE